MACIGPKCFPNALGLVYERVVDRDSDSVWAMDRDIAKNGSMIQYTWAFRVAVYARESIIAVVFASTLQGVLG